MFRLLTSVAFLAVTAHCCTQPESGNTKPDPQPESKEVILEASLDMAAPFKSAWAAGDQIVVYSIKGNNGVEETLTAAGSGSTVEFKSSGDLIPDADGYYAYIPGSGVTRFRMMKYFVTGDPQSFAVPSMCVASCTDGSGKLVFRNIFGLVAVDVKDADVKAVELKGNRGETITGGKYITFENLSVQDDPNPAFTPSTSIRTEISKPGTVYFGLIPDTDFSAGYSVNAYDAEGDLIYKSENVSPLTVESGRVYQAAELEKQTVFKKTDKFNENDVVLSLAVLSDIHINTGTTMPSNKFTSALQQLKAKALANDLDGLDAVLVAGDLIDNPVSGYLTEFKNRYEGELDPEKVPMIYTVGNHDVPNYRWSSTMVGDAAYMRNGLGSKYFTYDVDKTIQSTSECRHCIVGNAHVLCVTPNGTEPIVYSLETVNWLDQQLKNITNDDPEAYVYVLTHPMIYNTVYGSDLGTYWYTSALTSILGKYPQVMAFGGHLHFPLNDPRSIWQGDFTVFGTASCRYMAIEPGGYVEMAGSTTMLDKDEFSQGHLLQVDRSGNVRAYRMDFYNGDVIGEPYDFTYPKADKSHLSTYSHIGRKQANKAPTLSSLEVRESGPAVARTYSAVFAAGADDEFVHDYTLTLKKDGNTYATQKILADFYKHPKTSQMKQEWVRDFGALPAGNYELSLVAKDSWGAVSNTLTKTFKAEETAAGPVETDIYVDIDFADGSVTDKQGNATLVNHGATIAATSVKHAGKTYDATVAAQLSNNNYIYGTFKEIGTFNQMQAFANAGFSVEVFYVDREPGTVTTSGVHGILCATQDGGWGLAVRKPGNPYFIVGDNKTKTYKNVDAPSAASTSELTHLVGVYDVASKTIFLYVNGNLSTSTSFTGPFYPGISDCFNRFALGTDVAVNGTYGDFPVSNMTIVDAKVYSGALDATKVKAAYQNAVNALK